MEGKRVSHQNCAPASVSRVARRHPEEWIETHVQPRHSPMKMGACSPTGLSHIADQLALFDVYSELGLDRLHMKEGGLNAETVVDYDRTPGKKEVGRDQPDDAGR